MTRPTPSGPRRWLRSPVGLAFLGLAAIAAFFLVTEHTAHTLGALPFVLLALCPLLHIFMHRGHGDHGGAAESHQHGAHGEREDV